MKNSSRPSEMNLEARGRYEVTIALRAFNTRTLFGMMFIYYDVYIQGDNARGLRFVSLVNVGFYFLPSMAPRIKLTRQYLDLGLARLLNTTD